MHRGLSGRMLGIVPLCCVQVVEDGYEFFAKRQLVTLFSAPNYCGEFDNAGGMMSVDESLMCSFQVLPPSLPLTYTLSYAIAFVSISQFSSFQEIIIAKAT